MKMTFHAAIIAAVLFIGQCNAAEWLKYPYGELLFQFNKEMKNWKDAKAACEANGGYLAEPSICPIDRFLRQKVKGLGHQDWWIGGSDDDNEGEFMWQHSDKSVEWYKNWYPGEPNNAGNNQDCMQYWKDAKWDDDFCNKKKAYICQKAA